MVWVKGTRCGVDNCASRFYEVVRGQRVCQNGHVQLGLETAADDDDHLVVGKRERRVRSKLSASQFSQADREPAVLTGRSAKLKILSLQLALYRKQVEFVSRKTQAPPEFELAARSLWATHLSDTKRRSLAILEMVALVYLAARMVGLPVLLLEFIEWIHQCSDFPFYDGRRFLDKNAYKLVPYEISQLMSTAPPNQMSLQRAVTNMRKKLLRINPDLHFHEVDDVHACYFLCRKLAFPPTICEAAVRILQMVRMPRLRPTLDYLFETPAACAVVVAAKLYYGLDGVDRQPPVNEQTQPLEQRPEHQQDATTCNWNLWRDVMRKLYLYRPDFDLADERLVQFWGRDQMENFMSTFQIELGPDTSIDKRLGRMFPWPELKEPQTPTGATDDEALVELCALIHSAVDEDQPPRSDSPSIPAGAFYQIYTPHRHLAEELPQLVETLYAVLTRLLGFSEILMRKTIYSFELLLTYYHRRI